MKTMLPAILFLITVSISACNKCYECKTSTDTQTYCKDSPGYNVLKAGGSLTDNNGQTYNCTLK